MMLTRRQLLASLAATGAFAGAGRAFALTEGEARALVEVTIRELKVLLREPGTGRSRAEQLRAIMETRANVPLLARFVAGRTWREMSDDQQQRFTAAYSKFLAITYSRRFDEYSGDPNINLGRTIDAGRKGMLVESPITPPSGPPIAVEWLVSDRGGKVEIVDIVIEGISMAATQRDEIGAMIDKRGGDVEALIADLTAAG